MPNPKSRQDLADLAEEILELSMMGSAARSRSRSGAAAGQLSETEYMALDVLAKKSPQSVGAVQKAVGVLPAQMSRIIRALENRDGVGLISCQINASDRRRIDVNLTAAGTKAHAAYRKARLRFAMELLTNLSVEDREEFRRLLGLLREAVAKRLKAL